MGYTKEHLEKLSRDIHLNEYEYILDKDYYNVIDKIKIICKVHGEYEQQVRYHLDGIKCKKCVYEKMKNPKRDKEYYVKMAKTIHGDVYNYDEYEYTGYMNKGKILCEKHGYFYMSMDNHVRRKNGCRKCANEKTCSDNKITNIEFLNRCVEIHNNKYILDKVKYISMRDSVIVGCEKHGYWETSAQLFIRGCGCPKCNESKGEKLITEILDNNGISYIRQYKYADCRGKYKALPFDFYIPSINTLIEYDGEHHYKPVKYFGGDKAFHLRISYDNIKTEYCKTNNIPLVRVSYTMTTDEIRNLIVSLVSV